MSFRMCRSEHCPKIMAICILLVFRNYRLLAELTCGNVAIIIKTRKRFKEKPIVVFTNTTVFILDFYIII